VLLLSDPPLLGLLPAPSSPNKFVIENWVDLTESADLIGTSCGSDVSLQLAEALFSKLDTSSRLAIAAAGDQTGSELTSI